MEYIANFDHPNLCKILEIYEDEKNFYVVSEIVKGGDMIDNIYYSNNFNEGYASNIIRQLLEVASYFNSKGVCHNEIIPVNVIHVNKFSTQIKVIDLDRVGSTPIKDMDSYMRKGDYSGWYVAPELIKGEWSPKVDLFPIGCFMYYFVMG